MGWDPAGGETVSHLKFLSLSSLHGGQVCMVNKKNQFAQVQLQALCTPSGPVYQCRLHYAFCTIHANILTHIHTHQNTLHRAQRICQHHILYTSDGWCDADCAALQLFCTGCADQPMQPDARLVEATQTVSTQHSQESLKFKLQLQLQHQQ